MQQGPKVDFTVQKRDSGVAYAICDTFMHGMHIRRAEVWAQTSLFQIPGKE